MIQVIAGDKTRNIQAPDYITVNGVPHYFVMYNHESDTFIVSKRFLTAGYNIPADGNWNLDDEIPSYTYKEKEWKVVNIVEGMDVVLMVNGEYVGERRVSAIDETSISLEWVENDTEFEEEITDFEVEWDVLYHQPRICIVIEPPEISDPDVKWDGISDHHYL